MLAPTLRRTPALPARWLLVLLVVTAAVPAVALGEHAVARHGDDALAIRQCLDRQGPYQLYRDKTGTYFQLCRLPDGRWGAQLIRKANGAWREVTAYVKGDGSFDTVLKWLWRQGATRFTGTLP